MSISSGTKTTRTLLTPEETAQLPDLPGLESVETRDYSALPVLIIHGIWYLLFTVFAVWQYIRLAKYIETPGKAMVGLVLLLMAWLILRILSGTFYYKTDRSGLTMKGILRRRFLSWTEVQKAVALSSKTGDIVIELTTVYGRIKINPSSFGRGSSGDLVIASIRQHLKEAGWVIDIALPESALKLWEPIPDDVPQEMDWEKPISRGENSLLAFTIMLFLTCLVYLWSEIRFTAPSIAMVCFATFCFIMIVGLCFLPEITKRIWSAKIRDSYLEARSQMHRFYIPWSDVTSANWVRSSLRVRSIRGKEILVPYNLGSKESETLILCLIGKLRTAGNQAVAIPELLSTEPDILTKPMSSSRQIGKAKQAFLNSLDTETRKKLVFLRLMEVIFFLIGIVLAMSTLVADPVIRLSYLLHAASDPNTRYFLVNQYYGAALAFPIIILCAILGSVICTRLAGQYKDVWTKYEQIGYPELAKKITICVCAIILICGVVIAALGTDSYIRVTDRGFGSDGFYTMKEQFHSWSEVSSLEIAIREVADGGRTRYNWTYTISFTDGTSWRLDGRNTTCRNRSILPMVMDFASKKSGKMIVYK